MCETLLHFQFYEMIKGLVWFYHPYCLAFLFLTLHWFCCFVLGVCVCACVCVSVCLVYVSCTATILSGYMHEIWHVAFLYHTDGGNV